MEKYAAVVAYPPSASACANSITGQAGTTVILTNSSAQVVTVTGVSGATWPFYSPTTTFTVPANGSAPVVLIQQTGSYLFNSDPCLPLNNPKNVIINP